jgi:hypothetical protein
MELKNTNPNCDNVLLCNRNHIFYLRIVKIEFKNQLKILFQEKVSTTTCKTKLLITFISLIKIEVFKAFHVEISISNQNNF